METLSHELDKLIDYTGDSDEVRDEDVRAVCTHHIDNSIFAMVDAVAEGESRDMFRLRIGPVSSIEAGDKLCNKLGRRGVTCMVVRTQ